MRQSRLEFDGFKCVVCHKSLINEPFESHHLSYLHLGNEHMRDVVSMCKSCHATFHNNWQRQQFWKGREADHWEAFNIQHTARLCSMYWKEDRFISGDINAPNFCSKDASRQLIDRYLQDTETTDNPVIDSNDITLFVRNKRWEMVFEAEKRGLSVEQFLDEKYGEKVRGKNPIRSEAGQNSSFKHDLKSMHRHYRENPNINKLMEEAKKYD